MNTDDAHALLELSYLFVNVRLLCCVVEAGKAIHGISCLSGQEANIDCS